MGAVFPYFILADSEAGRAKEDLISGRPPRSEDTNLDIRHGFAYQRAKPVTLGSISRNSYISEGLSREEIDAAIYRGAELELLYDEPFRDEKVVRVTGPFTVESLSPHRSLAFSGSAMFEEEPTTHVVEPESFEQTILDNLVKAGVQNGRRNERLEFETIEPYAGQSIQALGIRADAPDGTPKRVALSIGPQYGTVSPQIIKQAAREAIAAPDVDLLCVLGFAFDPAAIGATDDYIASGDGFASVAAERSLGRVPVLLVRMNADLLMGEDLKKTGKGNLFTVFGEPDVAISPQADGTLVVEIKGVDVYDPTTGEVRSHDADRIALWMIDTNYNDESFFVRHCYFTGGNDPYARLRKALKADIDEDAWASLYRTVCRPFDRPETGKIAVKVINDYGDEVMKVFEHDSAGRPLTQ